MKRLFLSFILAVGVAASMVAQDTTKVKAVNLLPSNMLKCINHYTMKNLASHIGNSEELYDGFVADYKVVNAQDSTQTNLTCLFYGPKHTASSIKFIVSDYKAIMADFEAQEGFPKVANTRKYNHYKMENYDKRGRLMDIILKYKGVACRITPVMTNKYSVEYYSYTY